MRRVSRRFVVESRGVNYFCRSADLIVAAQSSGGTERATESSPNRFSAVLITSTVSNHALPEHVAVGTIICGGHQIHRPDRRIVSRRQRAGFVRACLQCRCAKRRATSLASGTGFLMAESGVALPNQIINIG